MEVDEIQGQGCNKFPRIGNSRGNVNAVKLGQKVDMQYPDDEEDGRREVKRNGDFGGSIDFPGAAVVGRLSGWPSSMSRIVRVSRATGGKDRHSKVLTSKGLRDRRVRLSVTTAIQFYDLQDRLGYDQPSKAVEWLLKAAASSIAELPSLNTSFPDTPQQLSDEKRSSGGTEHGFDSVEMDGDLSNNNNNNNNNNNYQQQRQQQQQQNLSLSKSTCSSNSETSKGSGLSLSRTERSESRVKARERARGRAAEKEKEKEIETTRVHPNPNVNHLSQNSSFTELLTTGIGINSTPNGSTHHQNQREWCSAPMEYFATGLLGSSSQTQQSSGFTRQIHMGNSLPQPSTMFSVNSDHHHQEMQHFSFVPDHLVPTVSAGAGAGAGGSEYNLNFSISSSSGLSGFNRGTLQSNSPSLFPHVQRFSSIDGSNLPFFMGTAPLNAAAVENHHQFLPGFDGRLHLCYGDGNRRSDQQKGKGKN